MAKVSILSNRPVLTLEKSSTHTHMVRDTNVGIGIHTAKHNLTTKRYDLFTLIHSDTDTETENYEMTDMN